MNVRNVAIIAAALLLLGALLYWIIRWRYAPAAFRAIGWVGAVCFAAGFLAGLWALHEIERIAAVSPGVPASDDRVATATPAPSARAAPLVSPREKSEQALYVLTELPAAVTGYQLPAGRGAVAKLSISGPHTGLEGPTGVAIDAAGNTYIVNRSGQSVVEFRAGSNGDVLPAKILAGPATRLEAAYAIAVAPDGATFVATRCGTRGLACLLKFAADAEGNAAPLLTVPLSERYSSLGWSLAVDAAGSIWFPNSDDSRLVRYKVSGSGATTPTVTISGPTTGLENPDAVAIDERGYLYAANRRGRSVTVYRPDSAGATPPVATIFGPATELKFPHGIAVTGNEVYVANASDDRVLTFETTANGDVPPLSIFEVRPEGSESTFGKPSIQALATGALQERSP